MNPDRKKGTGYNEVRACVLGCLYNRNYSKDPYIRINSEEIADAIGITPQAVNIHIREMVRRGLIIRSRRFYFALPDENMPVNVPENASRPIQRDSGELSETFPKTFSQESSVCTSSQHDFQDFLTSFSDISDNFLNSFSERLGTFSESKMCSKKRNQEKEKENKKEKSENEIEIATEVANEKNVDLLGDHVDPNSEDYLKAHQLATKLFNRFGAGVRKGTSPVLINRFVAGLLLKIPLINFPELEEQLRLAEQETAKYESFKGFGKQTGIRRPFIQIANYLKQCYEAAGWTWTACSSPFEFRLKKAHAKKTSEETTPIFPTIEKEIQASLPTPGTKSIFAAPEKPFQERELTPEEMRLASQYPSLFGNLKGEEGKE